MERDERKDPSGKEREAFLVEGAKKEGVLTLYGSTRADEFSAMMKVFKPHYPFIKKSNHLRASRRRLVSKILTEWRTKRNAVDIIQSVVYQGFDLLHPRWKGKFGL